MKTIYLQYLAMAIVCWGVVYAARAPAAETTSGTAKASPANIEQPKLESVCHDANPLMEMLVAGKFQWNTVFEPDKETPGLFKRMLDGPLAGVEEIVFAVRGRSKDYHYYASQGNYYQDAGDWQYGVGGGQLCRMNLRWIIGSIERLSVEQSWRTCRLRTRPCAERCKQADMDSLPMQSSPSIVWAGGGLS